MEAHQYSHGGPSETLTATAGSCCRCPSETLTMVMTAGRSCRWCTCRPAASAHCCWPLRGAASRSKLNVYLPHAVQEDKGKAQWDGKKQVLSVTLPIIREDF